MATRGEQFAGVTVALVTPLRGGDIDFPALKQLVEWHVEQGTDGSELLADRVGVYHARIVHQRDQMLKLFLRAS